MAGRIRLKDRRVWCNGYDVSGYSREIGPLQYEQVEVDVTALMSDTVKGYLPGHTINNLGTLNGVFDNTATTGGHTVLRSLAGSKATVLVAQGVQAAPAQGDPVFGGQYTVGSYQAVDAGGAVFTTTTFQGWAADATFNPSARPWGTLLHASGAETAAQTAAGVDDNAAASAAGGYMVYHVLAGDGTATITVQDASTNSDANFATLAGCTTGSIDCSAVQHGIVQSTTLTVKRYLRWQIALGTATTVTFVLAFFRA